MIPEYSIRTHWGLVRKFLLHEDYLEKNQSTTANLAASGDLRFLGEVVSSPDWPWPEGILPESWQFVDPSQPLTAEQVEEWGVPCSDCRAGLKLLSGSELTSQVAAGIGPGGKAEYPFLYQYLQEELELRERKVPTYIVYDQQGDELGREELPLIYARAPQEDKSTEVGFLTFWVENQQLRMAVTIRINPPLTEPLSQEGLWQYSQGTQLHELIHAADWETRIREKIKELKLSGEPINLSEIVNEVALEQRITDETRAFWAQMWYLAGETNWFEPTPEDDLPYVYGRGPQLNGLKYPFLYLKNLGVDLFQEREAIAAAANESDLEYLWWFLVDIKVFANEENQAFFQEQYLESPQFRVYIDECRRLDFISQAEYQWLFEGDSLRVAVSKETLEENPALCGGAIILAPAVVLLALLSLSRRSK